VRLCEKCRCSARDQFELFQRISEKGLQTAGHHGARNDRLQDAGVARVVGWEKTPQIATRVIFSYAFAASSLLGRASVHSPLLVVDRYEPAGKLMAGRSSTPSVSHSVCLLVCHKEIRFADTRTQNSLLSAAKNGRSKRGTRGSAIHHQLDRVDV
jgi:hypothetical protein